MGHTEILCTCILAGVTVLIYLIFQKNKGTDREKQTVELLAQMKAYQLESITALKSDL